ncbi:PREDICTED: mitochondrial phosphate carrier protein 1, mitochondrial-like [Nicotiana attenuata]|uniref:Mitochondrial phosphate carrier protein 1, mitochondrial n=1 Tax=Nicotiana attenuata TaxID=49451 RepID=A0A314LA86_NICAT|nr:PREDICTED: mitochondrial phosphate carrier protein 1, mitochondrial-like [Nicotiana attenuata]OIT38526.1 mitochondrial phosphate carrier protein 1, mitochondrial [Nicotiana attenuata]
MLKKSQMERVEGERWCEEFSAGYYGLCTAGGMLSAGVTHLAVTPLDVLKVNMQVDPLKYRGISSGFITLWREQGHSALWRGWSGKLFGYGVQGGCKFGLYEYFKRFYTDLLVDQQRSVIFFLSSASAQVFADVALCPFEAVKVQVQTQPHFARGLTDGFRKLYVNEGFSGFFKGLFPLWGRNLPFSMIMFSTFEHSVDLMYRKVIQRRKEDCSRAQQLGVTCLSGYVAGSVGTVISNPADNIVSFLYNKKADTIRQAIKKIGLVNLFTRSLPVRITIVGPVVTLQWFLYDTIKVFTGLPTSGGLIRHQKDPNLLLQ